jgi:predicted nuclease of predicted toxin-antitoxin system
MRFFLDENFPKAAASMLAIHGHEVFDVRGVLRAGAPDDEIFKEAQAMAAVFLTTDRDFFHTIPHLFDHHQGVLVIALRQPNRKNILAKLEWALGRFSHADFHDRVFQLRDNTWIAIPPM